MTHPASYYSQPLIMFIKKWISHGRIIFIQSIAYSMKRV
jgi:hypothetical protein